jgi:hypothetical protein
MAPGAPASPSLSGGSAGLPRPVLQWLLGMTLSLPIRNIKR